MKIDFIKKQLLAYDCFDMQEKGDKETILKYFDVFGDSLLYRKNKIAHLSASSWIVNKDRTKVLMIYHNIYNSWSWTGGHADGNPELVDTALVEAVEETGISHIHPLKEDICSIELLTVDGHIKKGEYVPSHMHVNFTYLMEADDGDLLRIKPDENSGVKWVDRNEAPNITAEPYLSGIYLKLNKKFDLKFM